MDNNRKGILYWELAGFFFILIVGSLLHFTYEWSGKMAVVGIFSAVNESVWEHLKLGYWSLFIFSMLEYQYIKNKLKAFFFAKFMGILSMEGFIVIFFYTYTAISGHHLLILDIGSYILGAAICQLISFKLLNRKISGRMNIYSLAGFILLGLLFIIFTFYPPNLPVFREPE